MDSGQSQNLYKHTMRYIYYVTGSGEKASDLLYTR